jgi:hypothetical protein
MLAIQGLRPVTRILILAREGSERGTRRCLAAIQVLRCFPLGIVTVYGRVLILEVQQEPEFHAWVRDGHVDSGGSGQVQRLGDIWMLVDIEYAPILAVCVAAAPPCRLEISHAPRSGLLDEGQRRTVGSRRW